jgi:tetratricopeptide (TPR) repeat protein
MLIVSVERERRKFVWSWTRRLHSTCAAGVVVAGTLSAAPAIFAQSGPIESARALYAAAAYDDALTVLNDLRAPDRGEDIGRVEYYRALCLLAVGRVADADAAIEAAVTAAPFAQPSEDTSPRVKSAFRDVRRRVLPSIIERKYADAKTAFDQRHISAADRFKEVIALIDDPDALGPADQLVFSQVRALATDYLALSVGRQSRQ